ncbi:MAG TPA: hypothetical protein VMW63_02600 [Methanoregulaceae archaeon]|nr:hypothetical protein [Methanoregulaceae archaeon]
MRRSRTFGVFVLVILILVLASGCIAPPVEDKNGGGTSEGAGSGPGKTTIPTTVTPEIIDTRFLTPATPYPTPYTQSNSSYTQIPEPDVKMTEYQNIYYNILEMNYQTVAYSYDLSDPPMIIEMCILPETVTRTIWFESRYGERKDVTQTMTYISQSAWFEVTVRDKNTGELVASEGFGKLYSVDVRKDITIRITGQYLIEFTGNDVSATVQIRIPLRDNTTAQVSEPLFCSS